MTLRSLAFVRVFLLALAMAAPVAAEPLRVVTTVPDLADLARTIGGDQVEVESLAKGPQDAHFVEPRPSFVKRLHGADLLVAVGMELEAGWLPALREAARNPRIHPGADGFLDASTAVVPLEVPAGRVDRSMGDVHPYGNPHYLTDPLNGLRVAAALRERLAALRPEASPEFASRYDAFARSLVERLVGPALAAARPPAEIAQAIEQGTLAGLLASSGAPLGGWLGQVAPERGRQAVEDHRAWIYFARRFGLELVGELEPLPGIAPTTRHLGEVVATMRTRGVKLILATPYFAPRHAQFVAARTGARIAELAHQVGSRPDTEDYLATVDYNVRQLGGSR